MAQMGVLGAGAWGTALGKLLADKGNEVWLWAHEPEVAEGIERDRRNDRYLPKVDLPPNLRATADPVRALRGAELVLLATPSHAMRSVLGDLGPKLPRGVPWVNAAKGIENESLMLVHDVVADVLGPGVLDHYVALSGPSFALEVARRHPTAVVIAGHNAAVTRAVQEAFSSEVFRAYSSTDLCGVELGGALKNVIAICAGASDGLGFGHNTRAGLITRGLAEIARLAVKKGASPLTMAGLAGMGDLVLTCTGDLSRNRTVGFELGRGKTLDEVLKGLGHVAEGVKTARSAHMLGRSLGVPTPIISEAYCALYENKPAHQAVSDLMTRALGPEIDFHPTGVPTAP
jgi:glycerol-3-phosphate dehydrogenase (NAD(P)+)